MAEHEIDLSTIAHLDFTPGCVVPGCADPGYAVAVVATRCRCGQHSYLWCRGHLAAAVKVASGSDQKPRKCTDCGAGPLFIRRADLSWQAIGGAR